MADTNSSASSSDFIDAIFLIYLSNVFLLSSGTVGKVYFSYPLFNIFGISL